MIFKDSLQLRGRFEIVNNLTGEKILDEKNLVLLITRAAILQILFNDDKIMMNVNATASDLIPSNLTPKNYAQDPNYRRMICGFAFGKNGNEPNTNPVIIRVPSPQDVALVTEPATPDWEQFIALPMVSFSGTGSNVQIYNTSGSYENFSEITNDREYNYNQKTLSEKVNGQSIVRYFNFASAPNSNNELYCKVFDSSYSTTTIDPTSSEIDYRIKLDVENFNLVGETFNEVGLVMADCKVEGGVITDIKPNSGVLATRLTFTPISLSSQLLSQFSFYYHIYI